MIVVIHTSCISGFQTGGGEAWDFPPPAKVPPSLEILKHIDVIIVITHNNKACMGLLLLKPFWTQVLGY